MEKPLLYQVSKRREEMYSFYYQGIGDRIKKRRLELKFTQEAVARGICSNTYVSKIENNKLVPNPEQLTLIMERIDMTLEEVGLPDQMVEYLEASIECFFYKDTKEYEKIFRKVEHLEFSSLVYIIRLGYYVLKEQNAEAKIYYDEMSRYYNSLEDFGFATFVIYGCFYNININDFRTARFIIDLVKNRLRNDDKLYALYSYLNFVTYGSINLSHSATISSAIAHDIFNKTGNKNRNFEFLMYSNIFRAYEGSVGHVKLRSEQLEPLSKKQKNYYLFVLSVTSTNSQRYLKLMDKDSEYYYGALYLVAIGCLSENRMTKYNEIKKKLKENRNLTSLHFGYLDFLKNYETKNTSMIKENIINFGLPFAFKNQNIFLIQRLKEEIKDIFSNKNRYKDALKYISKCEAEIKRIQVESIEKL